MQYVLLIILTGLSGFIIFIDFVGFMFRGKHVIGKFLIGLAELCSLFFLPFIYAGFGHDNVCCADPINTATFSPLHQLTIATIIILCLISYIYSKFRTHIDSPVIEVAINSLILIGIILNIFIAIHTSDFIFAFFGNAPIICLGILMLVKNQRLFIETLIEDEKPKMRRLERIAWNILVARPMVKFPVLFLICLPILLIITSVLLLFGQKPDSIIRAFTDTYKHGFSQWDYKCDNVQCGGHYLCSVAAKGHQAIVKPRRVGIRNGNLIICNRQLLVSNAFEELLQERLPFVHKSIRRQYNKVGHFIHCYYHIFNIKFVADFIYILMKPLQWFFVLALYTFDRNPENRIAKQYLSFTDRQQIDRQLNDQSFVITNDK